MTHNTAHGAAWVGLQNPKSPQNVGNIMRAAGCFGVSGVFYSGQRYLRAREFVTDTRDHHEQMPPVWCEHMPAALPEGAIPVAVELVEGAVPLMNYTHPENAFYVFGPEDGCMSRELVHWCRDVIYIPTTGCLNLAATVNIVLYDRLVKSGFSGSNALIRSSRDTNNRLRVKGFRRGDD